MPAICFYFQLHQPYRLADVAVTDVGTNSCNYFTDATNLNCEIFRKVAEKSYLPMLTVLQSLLTRYPDFKFTISVSGVFLEQAQEYEPRVIELLKTILAFDQVELLAETYYHSLASLYSPQEFTEQIRLHEALVYSLFKKRPTVFRNTELIYNNDIAQMVENMGYVGMLTEGVDRYLWGRKRTVPYVAKTKEQLPLLLKHAQLSDDIAFRFSEKSWVSWPLTVDQYFEWLSVYPQEEYINLFMDFETFGEHQWEDTGIFSFFEALVDKVSASPWSTFVTPTQVFTPVCDRKITKRCLAKVTLDTYDVPEAISWADVDRDLTAWRDNDLQFDSLRQIYALESRVLASNDQTLVERWRKLQTSDHFYYMCTKWANDGDVHAYFSPYQDPYEAYRRYAIVLADLQERMM